MKTKVYISTIIAALFFVSCDLNQLPQGDNITQGQYEELDDVVGATVRGIYSLLYSYGGDHDLFGQRAIDLYGDLCCGDVAMNSQRYGWFVMDEQGLTYQRASYFWTFYYNIIRNCNKGINVIDKYGRPELNFNPDSITDEQYLNGYYYAQLLTIRGWAYAALQRNFCKTPEELKALGTDIYTELSIPLYSEDATAGDTTVLGAPRSTAADVYEKVEDDLTTAILYFEAFGDVVVNNKLEVSVDVARMLLAYSYLNKGDNAQALAVAEDLIQTTSATIIPNNEVLTTGFNDVKCDSWIWGQDVTIETTTSLASFFGQCDIYSYSYASAGDVKGIDANLLKEITALGWDIREFWWGNYYRLNTRDNEMYQYAPDGKFFSATSVQLQGDRDWLSDNVLMRIETAFLIAAEAAWRDQQYATALAHLTHITDQRVKEGAETAYADYKNNLAANQEALGEAIRYNWRVELWGEGYGLQTFRRWGQAVSLGENHLRMNKNIVPSTDRVFTFTIPTSEFYYNPYIRPTTEMAVNNK